MHRHLSRGVSAGALILALSTVATAQQTLPTIDVGGTRAGAVRPVPAGRPSGASRAPVQAALSTPVSTNNDPASAAPSYANLNPPNGKLQLDTRTTTASRLGLTPRQTPSSIVIIDNATLRARGANTTQEALSQAPGIITSQQPGSAGTVCMRGFCGPQITQLVNGIATQYDVISARPIDSWLTDRIEVLGGASSYLWGQGAVGGSINYISKVANREQQGHEVFGLGGMYFNRRAAYGYNGQIGNTPNWIQFAAAYKGSDGYVEHSPHNSGVGSVSWLSDITPKVSNTVAVEFQVEQRDAYWGTPLLNPVFGNSVFPIGAPGLPVHDGQILPGTRFKQYNSASPVFDQQVLWVRDITEYRMDDQTQFKNMFYFYRADRQYENVEIYRLNATDQPFGGITFPPNSLVNRASAGSAFATRHIQSLIGNRTEGFHENNLLGFPVRFSGGIDVSWNDQTRYPGNGTVPGFAATVLPTYFGVPPFGPISYANGTAAQARNQLRTVALFAENRLTLMPNLNLITGIRWEDIEFARTNLRQPVAPTLANPFGDPAFFRRGYQPLTWRAALMYDITKEVNVYASYSTAADPAAGILLTNNAGGVRNFDLTTGWQAEAGTKFDFLDGRGSMTIAGYFIERKNLTIPDPLIPGNVIPVGQQSSNGIEINSGLQVTPELSLQGNLAWTNPKFVKFDEVVGGVPVSRAGNRPTNVPRWIANGFITYKFMPDWEWYFAARFVGDRFANPANNVRVPAYTTFDTAVSWTTRAVPMLKDTTFTARLKNITDAQWVEWATGTPMYIMGQPRTFEMSMSTRF